MPIISAILLLMLAPLFTPQDVAKTSTGLPRTPPALPNQVVKLVPPPLPAGFTRGQSLAPQSSIEKAVHAEYRDGVLRLKIGDTWLPTVGSCCFCPDGAEKPLQWEPAKPPAGPAVKR